MTTTDIRSSTVDHPEGRTGRARWNRLAVGALCLAALGPALMFGAGLLWGLDLDDDAVFFLVTIALACVGALLLRSRRTVLRIVGVVVALLVGLSLFWTAFGLATPDSFFDFVPGLLVIPGALTGLVAGIASIRAERRGDVVDRAGRGERTVMTVGLGALGLLVVVSAVLTLTGRETVSGDDADATITLGDFEFDAGESGYDLEPGDVVLVRNDDPFFHTFTVDELGIDVDLGPGSEELVTIPGDASGGYVLYCEPHTGDPDDPASDDMASTLRIG